MGRPQFADPSAPEADRRHSLERRGARCAVRLQAEHKAVDRTIYIKVVAGFMREGGAIVAQFGTDERGPGIRMQTFVDPEFCSRSG